MVNQVTLQKIPLITVANAGDRTQGRFLIDGDIKFNDHVAVWSRVDWMMSQGPEKWRKFLFAVKGRVDPKTWAPDQTDLVGRCATRSRMPTACRCLQFDEKWIEWVKATYPLQ